MRVLVTGSRGLVGSAVVAALSNSEHEAIGFDLVDGGDILDAEALRDAIHGCGAVVHAAALLDDQSDADVIRVNVAGTSHVLAAATKAHVQSFVYMSSVNALGIFKGQRPPDYLPIDNEHSCYPSTAYGRSKCLAEQACRAAAGGSSMTVTCLRAPAVWTLETYSMIRDARAREPSFEWHPYWEYGAFIDARDLASACLQAANLNGGGHRTLLVASSDISTSGKTSRESASYVHSDVEWRGGAAYDEDPYRSLIDIEPAARSLDWRPVHTWREFSEGHA